MLAQLVQDQLTLAFSDGTGRGSQVVAGAYLGDNNQGGAFLGNLASVEEGERQSITLAIKKAPTNRKLCILTDSMTAINTALQLSRGEPPRSGVEIELRNRLIRSHIAISGNTHADRIAEFRSQIWEISTQHYRHLQRPTSSLQGQQEGRPHADWFRNPKTRLASARPQRLHLVPNREPQKSWLHKIGKGDDPSCPCGHPVQTGAQITFHCPLHNNEKNRLLRGKKAWTDLDTPDWRKQGDDPPYDAIESFFDYLYFES